MDQEKGFEPLTTSFRGWRSTAELLLKGGPSYLSPLVFTQADPAVVGTRDRGTSGSYRIRTDSLNLAKVLLCQLELKTHSGI